jgi:PAS domain S-box-containing protein
LQKKLGLDTLEAPFVLRNNPCNNERDEFNILAKAINEMRTNLKDSYLQLQEEIIERRKVEETLKENQIFNETILSMSPDIIHVYDLDRKENVYSNEGIMKVLGYTIAEIQHMGDQLIQNLMHPDDFSFYLEKTVPRYASAQDNELIQHEYRMRHKNGNWFWLFSKESIFKRHNDGTPIQIFGIITDITERKHADDQIKSSLKEKETLLHEIHHRVKNNMQVINSLLKLQANNIEDQHVKSILKDSQSRVYAMSAVHETLHGSENLSEIDLQTYLSKITTSVFQTYSANQSRVKLNCDIENSPIIVNQAYPIGLIINELISNALKYAFPEDRTGEISVSMKKTGNERELTVMDDGVGISDGFDWKNSKSLGLKLVRTLVENQLDGSIDMESNNGTKFTIKFNIEA